MLSDPVVDDTHTDTDTHGDPHDTDTHVDDSHGHDDHDGGHHNPVIEVVCLIFIALLLGQLVKQCSARVSLPYTTLITIIGLIVGMFHTSFGQLDIPIQAWCDMDPHLIMFLFLPPLIFESAFNTDWHMFRYEFYKILILAGPALIVATILTAVVMRYILGWDDSRDVGWASALMIGAILSATDPVAVVALLKELGASKRLSTLIEGESLMNDGTAMVVFLVLFDLVEGKELKGGEVVERFFQLALGGMAWGIAAGIILHLILARLQNMPVLEVNSTIFMAFLVFYTAEITFKVSGILAIVGMGIYMSANGKYSISTHSMHAIHNVWGWMGFTAETVVFLLTGFILGRRMADDSLPEESGLHEMTDADGWKILALFVFLNIIRFLVTLMFWPCLTRVGYEVEFSHVIVCSYSGLRGAVGLTLALIVFNSSEVNIMVRDLTVYSVGMVALLTLIINATTVGYIVNYLGLSKQSDFAKNVFAGAIIDLDTGVDHQIDSMRTNRNFAHVDWESVRDAVDCKKTKEDMIKYQKLKITEATPQDPSNLMVPAGKNAGNARPVSPRTRIDPVQLKNDLRMKYMTLLKSTYQNAYDHGTMMEMTMIMLVESVDDQCDDEAKELRDFDYMTVDQAINDFIQADVSGMKWPVVGGIAKADLHWTLTTLYDYILNLIEGHQLVDEKIQKITSAEHSHIVDQIIAESKEQVRKAEEFLQVTVEDPFPEVVTAMQTRRAQLFLLTNQYHQVEEMLKNGQIEDRDSKRLLAELDEKIYAITIETFPEVPIQSQDKAIINSTLNRVFTKEEIEQALKHEVLEELALEKGKKIVEKHEKTLTGKKIIFVTRGIVLSKATDAEDAAVPRLGRGEFANLANLLPNRRPEGDSVDYEPDMLSVDLEISKIPAVTQYITLNLESLRNILAGDFDRLTKFWGLLAPRVFAWYGKNMPEFSSLTWDRINTLCHMCEVKLYKQGETISASNGGAILYGGKNGFELVTPGTTVGPESIDIGSKYAAFMHFEHEMGRKIADGSLTNDDLARLAWKIKAEKLKKSRATGNALDRLMVPRGNLDDGASYAIESSHDMENSRAPITVNAIE